MTDDAKELVCDQCSEKNRITHIHNKGFILCEKCGPRFEERYICRRLKPGELQTLQRGEPLPCY